MAPRPPRDPSPAAVPAITPEMVARSRVVADPRWSPDGARLAWLEVVGGRADVVVAPADGSAAPAVVSADVAAVPARPDGGGVLAWVGRGHVAYAGVDGSLVLVAADGGPARVLSGEGRAAAPAAPPDGSVVAFVRERERDCGIVVLRPDGAGGATVSGGAAWSRDPAWSPDGRRLAWHEWDEPAMPWDGSRVVVSAPDGSGARVVAGGEAESVGQPRFAPDGSALAFVSDASGWANVWVAGPDGRDPRPLLAEAREHAEPAWGAGQRSFAWSPDARSVAVQRNEDGFGRLVVVASGGGEPIECSRGWHHGLDWGPAGIVAVRSGARTPSRVTVLDPAGAARREVARGPVAGFEAAGLVEPEPVTWPGADGGTVPGLLYRPPGRPGEAPPLLVDVHGGPTGQATAAWSPRPHFFVARGWAVLAPNPRGSTGYGRAGAQALAGGWGELDVDDVAAGIRAAGPRGWGDPARVAAIGGSAGGLVVLLLAARHGGLLRAAVSSSGVTDLAALAATTHRFEASSLDRLVGVLPRDEARYHARSPVTHGAAIRVPLLVLHGDADAVVPIEQARALVDAVRAAGGTVEHHEYEGEGHGWSRPETAADALRRIDAFLERHVLA